MEPHKLLESELARWSGVPNVVACSSGTAALHLALESLCLPQGSQVLVPDFAMVACARAVTLAGLVPVFVDCTDDLLMDLDQLDEAASECDHVRAVMPVHIYGRRCDMNGISTLARKHGLRVIEDLAEAHGVNPHSDSDAACWSFYRNKIVHGEEGGAIAFREPGEAILARQLRSLGFTDVHDFRHIPRGHNYRLADSLASLVLDSLRDVHEHLKARRRIETWYDRLCPPDWRMPPRDVVWCYDLRIPGMTSQRQDGLVRELQAVGIAARHGFKPMSGQEEYRHCEVFGKLRAKRLAREVIYLPVQPGVTTEGGVARAFEVLKVEKLAEVV